MSETKDYSTEDCSREAGFSAQFHILSEQGASDRSGTHALLQGSRGTDQPAHSEPAWPWPLGRGAYHGRRSSTGLPGRGHFVVFSHGHSLLLSTVAFSLVVKADVQ